jgi:hypothetical protein
VTIKSNSYDNASGYTSSVGYAYELVNDLTTPAENLKLDFYGAGVDLSSIVFFSKASFSKAKTET